MKLLGYGDEYCYVYNELNVYVVGENYFLFELKDIVFYFLIECGMEK